MNFFYKKQQSQISQSGQLLVEILLAVAVTITFVAFSGQLVSVSFRGSDSARERGNALRLAQESLEAVRAVAYGNTTISQGWNLVYQPSDGNGNPATSKGSANPYYPIVSTTTTPSRWILFTGTETVILEGETYTRNIVIDNVSRDSGGAIESVYNSTNDDPATQKITVTVSKARAPDTILLEYFTRFYNDSGPQTDWQGAASCGPVGATSSPTFACILTCITGSSTPLSFKLSSAC